MDAVTDHSRVTLHFEIRLEEGEVVDTNFDGEPATFSMGDGSLLPGFESVLIGLKPGERKRFSIPPEQAFGAVNPDNQHYFNRRQFKDMEIHEGLVLSFADSANTERPGVIAEIEEQRVLVDFNHPLAGRTLGFEVEIVSLEAGSSQQEKGDH